MIFYLETLQFTLVTQFFFTKNTIFYIYFGYNNLYLPCIPHFHKIKMFNVCYIFHIFVVPCSILNVYPWVVWFSKHPKTKYQQILNTKYTHIHFSNLLKPLDLPLSNSQQTKWYLGTAIIRWNCSFMYISKGGSHNFIAVNLNFYWNLIVAFNYDD